MTKQKRGIQACIEQCDTFFSAEELYGVITKKYSKLGIASVYRYLKQAEKKGELHAYVCDRRKIYSTSKKDHCHFTCERCSMVRHIHPKKLDFLKNEIDGTICHVQIDIVGVCSRCQSHQ
jgi:Fe2+ or Zn2+ uptake regulation protein